MSDNRSQLRTSSPAPTTDPAPASVTDQTEAGAADLSAPNPLSPTPLSVPPQTPLGRIPVLDVRPVVDQGARPSKSVVDEEFVVAATVFREGHDAVNASVVLTDPDGVESLLAMTCVNVGLSAWECVVSADRPGRWSYRVEGWSDPYGTWEHDATIKVGAGIDVELMLQEGALVLERAAEDEDRDAAGREVLEQAVIRLRETAADPMERLAAGTDPQVQDALRRHPLRELVSAGTAYPWLVERQRALYGAWYEIFPRSEGARWDPVAQRWLTGTLRTAAERLPAIAELGFDVVYLTPIHPIGSTARKGPNNSLDAGPQDPGSPYAIGSADGGHDAIHPELGTFEDFDAFVARAQEVGLEVAMDLALQCSPDHPWVTAHPEWFTTRADGTIAYAENPPKKYQDIYPVNFDNDPEGIYREVRRVVQVWLEHGVRIFRVDNPHTKPVEFWQWLIQDVATSHPDVIWLSEAFTKPAMMHTLAKVGFQQSYTYYAWRWEKWELEEYMAELTTTSAPFLRPAFWPTTHDILTPAMQHGGPTAWRLRAALAATLSPTYGIYTGYELHENVARPGAEEQIDNEKYQFKDRRWSDFQPGGAGDHDGLGWYLQRLNEIRRTHPSLHWLRNWHRHACDDESVMAFSKSRTLPDGSTDTILVVANLDPHQDRSTTVRLDMPALGMGWDWRFPVEDLITGHRFDWGQDDAVTLGPSTEPVHILHVGRY